MSVDLNCLDWTVRIETYLSVETREKFIGYMKEMIHCFTHNASDMLRIDTKETTHKLNVDLWCKLVKQKRMRFALEKIQAINEELDKLHDNGMVREVHYFDWLANSILVNKKNGKNKVCIDFTDLDKACPDDIFLLPMIDQLMDATASHEMMSFLDSFSGYNQILMHQDDQKKHNS